MKIGYVEFSALDNFKILGIPIAPTNNDFLPDINLVCLTIQCSKLNCTHEP